MSYYNKKCQKLKLDNMLFINRGGCAQVYANENIIFKEYYKTTKEKYRIDEKTFNILRTINNKHFIELFDIYCDFEFKELLKYIFIDSNFKIDGYTARYYEDNYINVLLKNKDYLLDNLYEIEALFEQFSDNGIYTEDLRRNNIILNKDNIILIDPDCYIINENFSTKVAVQWNKTQLYKLIKEIINISLDELDIFEKKYTAKYSLDIELDENISLTSEFSKKLKYVKKPIDLIRE